MAVSTNSPGFRRYSIGIIKNTWGISRGEHGTDGCVCVKESHHLISQQLLQDLGSQATRPRILRDLRHDIVKGLGGPHDITQTNVEEEIELATIPVRRSLIGVRQIRIHGDRDCARHPSLRSRGEFVVATGCFSLNQGSTSPASDPPTVARPSGRAWSAAADSGKRCARLRYACRSRTARTPSPSGRANRRVVGHGPPG